MTEIENRAGNSRFKKLARPMARMMVVIWAAWLVGQLIRDRNLICGLLLDIPTPIVAVALLAGSIAAGWLRNVRVAALFVTLSISPLCILAFKENQFSPKTSHRTSDNKPALRLVHWNVMRGRLGWNDVQRELRQDEADLYVLSEIPQKFAPNAAAVQFGPGYHGLRFGSMAVIGRGELSAAERLEKDRLKLYRIEWRHNGQNIKLLLVDIVSNPLVARRPLLERVRAQMETEQPDFVVGDFNTPRRSIGLDPLPTRYQHAYAAAGRGWSYTWPAGCSILAIDQCIVSDRIKPILYKLESSVHSDHRRQILDFSFHQEDR